MIQRSYLNSCGNKRHITTREKVQFVMFPPQVLPAPEARPPFSTRITHFSNAPTTYAMSEQPDEFERFLRHAEFAKVLELAGKLKAQKSRLVTFADPETNEATTPSPPSLTLRAPRRKSPRVENLKPTHHDLTENNPNHIVTQADFAGVRPNSRRGGTRQSHHMPPNIGNAAGLIRSALIPSTEDDSFDNAEGMPSNTIGRGEYPNTDSLIDETIKSLADELRYCLELKMQLREAAQPRFISPSNTEDKGSPLTVKYSKWQTDILTEWMIEHRVSTSLPHIASSHFNVVNKI